MDIKVFNTLTDKKERLEAPRSRSFLGLPIGKKKVKMFVCGPTVYDYIHLGNGRTFVSFDVIASYLKKYYKVFHLQNITDIDDKIINKAKDQNVTAKEVADKFTKTFKEDMKSLRIDSVDKYAPGSEHIDEIFSQIERLVDKGYAYIVPSVATEEPDSINNMSYKDVYFDVSKFEDYGKLSRQKLDEQESGTRINTESNKKDPRDFVLWKAQHYTYEPAWESPWGMGRPGWHIEDTAVSEKYLGQQYEIHCGGVDLKFPHHEAEIAQQEAASGKKPFVKYWLHSGHVTVNGEKMSKSLNNYVTIREALKEHSPEALRFFMLSAHYRSPIDYTEENIKQAESTLSRLTEFKSRVQSVKKEGSNHQIVEKLSKLKDDFYNSMNDDFNIPGALAHLFDFIREVNPMIDQNNIGKRNAEDILEFINEIDSFLKIIPRDEEEIPQQIKQMVSEMKKAREDKNYEESDRIRGELDDMGYQVSTSTSAGVIIRKKK